MNRIPPPLSKPGRDEPLAHRPKPLPPCGAVEPESGERCEGKAGHAGRHAARVLLEWETP